MNIDYSILVMGKIGSGKTTLIKQLSKKLDIPITSFGKMIKENISKTIENPSREQLQDFGYKTFSSDGAKKILEDAIKHSKNENSKSIIFDGVRHELVLNEIKKISKNIFTIFLDTNDTIRYSRYKNYSKSDITLENFQKISNHPIEQGIDKMKTVTNLVMNSSKSKEEIFRVVENEINTFLKI